MLINEIDYLPNLIKSLQTKIQNNFSRILEEKLNIWRKDCLLPDLILCHISRVLTIRSLKGLILCKIKLCFYKSSLFTSSSLSNNLIPSTRKFVMMFMRTLVNSLSNLVLLKRKSIKIPLKKWLITLNHSTRKFVMISMRNLVNFPSNLVLLKRKSIKIFTHHNILMKYNKYSRPCKVY